MKMTKRRLGKSAIEIEPLVLGTNVVGRTIDEAQSFRVLDAFMAEGFNALDTADTYGKGASETVIGNWLRARGNRDKVLVFTKVGSEMAPGQKGLSAKWIIEEVEHSLKRLQTDYIDLYQSHRPDPDTPEEETLRAYESLIQSGKVRALGCSNYDTTLLRHALDVTEAKGLPRYDTLQNEYNLYDRAAFEEVQGLCVAENVSGIHYFSLAKGFVSGKYRTAADASKSPRGPGVVEKYLNEKGFKILAALDAISATTGAGLAEIALAWLNAQPGTAAPIASATTVEQVAELARGARLTLGAEDVATLTEAGR
jgi:aryl-alcohol dehydrogenase-like predicted oxidoreductase